MRLGQVAMLIAALFALSGCSASSVSGVATSFPARAPTVGPSPATAAPYDSCTALSDPDLRELGLDPATKRKADLGINGDIAAGCGWSSAVATVSISVGTKSVQDYLGETNLKPRAQSIDGRDSVILVVDPAQGCGVVLPSSRGDVLVSLIVNFGSEASAGDPCRLTVDIATKLAPKLPR